MLLSGNVPEEQNDQTETFAIVKNGIHSFHFFCKETEKTYFLSTVQNFYSYIDDICLKIENWYSDKVQLEFTHVV